MKDSVNVRDAVDSGKSNTGALLYSEAYGEKTFKNSPTDVGSKGGVVPEATVSADGIVFGAPDKGAAAKDRQQEESKNFADPHKPAKMTPGSANDSDAEQKSSDQEAVRGSEASGRRPVVYQEGSGKGPDISGGKRAEDGISGTRAPIPGSSVLEPF